MDIFIQKCTKWTRTTKWRGEMRRKMVSTLVCVSLSCASAEFDCARANQFSLLLVIYIHCCNGTDSLYKRSSHMWSAFCYLSWMHAINCQSHSVAFNQQEKSTEMWVSFDEFGIWFGLVGASWMADCCCYTCLSHQCAQTGCIIVHVMW